jgi:hypothetical protein
MEDNRELVWLIDQERQLMQRTLDNADYALMHIHPAIRVAASCRSSAKRSKGAIAKLRAEAPQLLRLVDWWRRTRWPWRHWHRDEAGWIIVRDAIDPAMTPRRR